MLRRLIISFTFLLLSLSTWAQCSVCTRTAQQLGEEPAKGLNAGILYLAALPLTIIGVVFYQWKKNRQ
ncbi:MAG: hypothetical protein SFU20_14445 [Chitinophagaceae bacterium]|nr:hypothetical protein [Chitinophagaceae bacterium]MDX1956727.1 hypothetical protein [Chitinophagaceae bacterium]